MFRWSMIGVALVALLSMVGCSDHQDYEAALVEMKARAQVQQELFNKQNKDTIQRCTDLGGVAILKWGGYIERCDFPHNHDAETR